MKTIILIISALLVARSMSAATCAAANYCMGCDATTADKCVSCFNWGDGGSVGPRALNTTNNNCQTAITSTYKVANCKIYPGGQVTTQSARSVGDCSLCTKKYKTWVASSSTLACTDTAITLTSATCAVVTNCEQTVCYDTTGTDTVACSMCKKGYSGASWEATNSSGSASCSSGNTITNCEMQYQTGASTNACYYCKSKYAVANDSASCVSYTTDSNCQHLQSGNTECRTCWYSYYWSATKCKLAAGILATGMMAVLSALF